MSTDPYENSDRDPLMVPTRKEWDEMSEMDRILKEREIISALEREFNMMGETTLHFDARASATEVLRRYFKGQGKAVFVASDLHTLYPGERAFYPDLLVVFDVPDHHRRSWNVMREGKGLDFVLEILSRDTKRKDMVEKLNLYARVKIPEYFIFDPDALKLRAYHLAKDIYQEIPAKGGFFFSKVLGLQVRVDGDKIRFSVPEGLEVPFADELTARLNEKIGHKDKLIADYARDLENMEQTAEEERKRAEDAEEEIKRLRALLHKQS